MNSLILGHSFIKRLKRACDAKERSKMSNTFDIQRLCNILFKGIGGLTVNKLTKNNGSLLRSLLDSTSPDIVFLQIGGNDLSNDPTFIKAEEISLALVNVAILLHSQYGVKEIIIGHIMPRFKPYGAKLRQKNLKKYNRCVQLANILLQKEAATYNFIKIWNHNKKFQTLDKHVEILRTRFHNDGVHLSKSGTYYYYKSIRGALIGACRRISSKK